MESSMEKQVVETPEQVSPKISVKMTSKVIQYPVKKLVPSKFNHISNPESTEKFEELRKSIKANGILQPLVISPEGTIYCGHHRWLVAEQEGMETVPVIQTAEVLDQSDELGLVVVDNLIRRQMTRKQRMDLYKRFEASYNDIISRPAARSKGTLTFKETAKQLARRFGLPERLVRSDLTRARREVKKASQTPTDVSSELATRAKKRLDATYREMKTASRPDTVKQVIRIVENGLDQLNSLYAEQTKNRRKRSK
jgi:ParB-like chromosome segregation protein Spo0J